MMYEHDIHKDLFYGMSGAYEDLPSSYMYTTSQESSGSIYTVVWSILFNFCLLNVMNNEWK